MSLTREFSLIERYFRPLAGPAARGLADDAAVLGVAAGRALVISADAMNEGVHFLAGTDPSLIARKLLRVNLSDLAAMGAAPLGYLLTLALPGGTGDDWFESFSAGLARDQAAFGVTLLGGDSTRIDGPASLSLTILGTADDGAAIPRGGARPGDGIWVSGTIGDAALGLAALRGELADPDGALATRYHLPTPRLGLADGLASAAIDISDGLFAELGHLCRHSRCGAAMDTSLVPLSAAALAAGAAWRGTALRGGDDYELLMAVAPEREQALRERAAALGTSVTRIGLFREGTAEILADGVPAAAAGWSHFG
jgi:thiamine-monophosphate kinase